MAEPGRFACTGCGDCCRGFAREQDVSWKPQEGPVVRLSAQPGLPLMSWEWQRLRALAAERGIPFEANPFDAVLDEAHERLVVLSYRMLGDACRFLEARADLPLGERSKAWGFTMGGVCGIYEHRPLACRAYPLVPMARGIALSIHCPELVDADPDSDAALERIYGDCLPGVRAFQRAPRVAALALERLEALGDVRLAFEPTEAQAEHARAAWPRVDLCDLMAAQGMEGWQALEARAWLP